MSILEHLDKIERAREAQKPLLRALRLYGEVERAGYPPTTATLKGSKLVPCETHMDRHRAVQGISKLPTGLIKGIELASGASITFPEPIQYP